MQIESKGYAAKKHLKERVVDQTKNGVFASACSVGKEVDGTALRQHGGDFESEEAQNQDDYNNLGQQGTSRAYWTARLKRDRR